jgi:hypothetical protein
MPEVNVLSFSVKEVLEVLIKKADLHEGRWILSANFSISPGNFGPTNAQMAPGVAFAIANLAIQRVDPTTPIEMSLDASTINPTQS